MGFSATLGNAQTAPLFVDNATGAAHWSGISANEFSSELVRDVIAFCKEEGYRQGWNDANYQRIELDNSNLFHPDFLCAVPYYAWRINYLFGVYQFELNTQKTLAFSKPDLRHEIPLVEQAVFDIKTQFSLPELGDGIPALRRAF